MTVGESSSELGDDESEILAQENAADVPPVTSTDQPRDDNEAEAGEDLGQDKHSRNFEKEQQEQDRQQGESHHKGDDDDDDDNDNDDDDDDDDDEDEEEEEPRLKYATLTNNLSSLYRNGDPTSSCFVCGDKMIIGTHNGNIHVFSMPSLRSLKVYRAHHASVTSISISPLLPPLSIGRLDAAQRLAPMIPDEGSGQSQSSPSPKKSPRQPPVPRTASNDIYIATSSIDGHVCISSLIDPDDVQLRDFGRPVQAVALSPEYKSDRSYLSGGQAGSLVLTTGGQKGKSVKATVSGSSTSAGSWLGTIGLGGNIGTDKVLHSGEGIISTIKWSPSGNYVLWVNEQGIKIMRSNLHLPVTDTSAEWKRISHIDRPNTEESAAVWKASAEWIDRNNLESEDATMEATITSNGNPSVQSLPAHGKQIEEVVVGWSDRVWLIKVTPPDERQAAAGEVGFVHMTLHMQLGDCTIAGISMYTQNLLLILAYMQSKGDEKSKKSSDGTRKGRGHRHNGLKPELRLIDINTQVEVESDTLSVNRFETLSSSDYHLAILPPTRVSAQLAQRGYLGAIGSGVTAVGSGIYSGVETVGQGMWDATMYGPRKLGADRLFSSAGSIRSGRVGNDPAPGTRGTNYLTGWIPGLGSSIISKDDEQLNAIAVSQGMKIFVFSPFDCIVAVKRNIADRLQWLTEMQRYRQAWELLDEHPEAAGPASDSPGSDSPPTPSKASSVAQSGSTTGPAPARAPQQNTLAEFFADAASISSSQPQSKNSSAEKEKRRIGESWLQQLVTRKEWSEAGEVAEKVLDTTSRWDHWVWKFVRNKKFDEIAFHVPTFQITPPLPSQIFEIILGHYVSRDRRKFKELLDQWPSDLFEISSITSVIEDQLEPGVVPKDSEDWCILQECLAKLCLADGHYDEALRCYIRVQDADTAMSLLKEHHLVDAIADDIPSLVLLRITRSQLKSASNEELEDLSSDSIKVLVDEATLGVVEIDDVVAQLQAASLTIFLFFYLRGLWRGEGSTEQKTTEQVRDRVAGANLVADEGKALVEQYADTAVELFAEYDRDLLMQFLHYSTSYTYEKALKICERHHYIEEQVYLLSKTGSMKKALYLIIDKLQDVSKAITFAKHQDDKGLWDDFLEYSMSRPKFISGLLAEIGTAIDPIELVKRIPSGLEIEGLKDGLVKMLREYDIQDSISIGAARVLSSEVAVGMNILREGRRRGIKFDIPKHIRHRKREELAETGEIHEADDDATKPEISPGHCAACLKAFTPDESETLIGFACGHVYHVPHLLHEPGEEQHEHEFSLPKLRNDDENEESLTTDFPRSVAPKVTNARLLKDKVEEVGGCKICKHTRDKVAEV